MNDILLLGKSFGEERKAIKPSSRKRGSRVRVCRREVQETRVRSSRKTERWRERQKGSGEKGVRRKSQDKENTVNDYRPEGKRRERKTRKEVSQSVGSCRF